MTETTPLWEPSDLRIAQSNLQKFMGMVNTRTRMNFSNYRSLYDWSINNSESFWRALIDFSQLRASSWGDKTLVDGGKMPGAQWFPDAKLNYAENMLCKSDDSAAIVFRNENGLSRTLSWQELTQQVATLSNALRNFGIQPGDRVAAIAPNIPETIIWFLATVSVGGIWSSCSPDFGTDGVLDRFSQIAHRILVTCDGYSYNGKRYQVLDKLATILDRLPDVEMCVVIPYASSDPLVTPLKNTILFDDLIAGSQTGHTIFEQLPFSLEYQ